MEYRLNFSFLDSILLQEEKIIHKEITEVFRGNLEYTVWKSVPPYSYHKAYYYIIGFSIRKRFLQVALSCDGDEVCFFDVKVAGLTPIKQDFFGKV